MIFSCQNEPQNEHSGEAQSRSCLKRGITSEDLSVFKDDTLGPAQERK